MKSVLIEKISSLPGAVKTLSEDVQWDYLKERKVQAGVLAAVAATYILYKQVTKKRYNLPPGPVALPLVGNALNGVNMGAMVKSFHDLSKTYGPIVTIYLGPQRTVVLNDMTHIREAFVEKGVDFADRPKSYLFQKFSDGGKSIASGQYGPVWKVQRKIAHSALRKYAQGENIERLVENSFHKLTVLIDKDTEAKDPGDFMMTFIYNVFATLCFGKQYETDDPFVNTIRKELKEFNDYAAQFMLVDTFPILASKIFGLKIIEKMDFVMDLFMTEFGKEFDEHMANYDPANLDDFMYDCIHLWKKAQEEDEEKSVYQQLTKNHFIFTMLDVFTAGTDTTRITMTTAIKYLTYYPEMQKKVHDEIDEALGKDGKPNLRIKQQLPFLNAVLHEIMRIEPVAANGVPHVTRCDTTLGKYDIPKDTMVFGNAYAVHLDPKEFKNPDTFDPNRWIDENGKYNSHLEGSWIPFSMGVRNCVGEALAKVEIPLAMAWFLQRYRFEKVPGEDITLEPNDLGGGFESKPFKVNFVLRD